MNTGNDELNRIGYVSSSSELAPRDEARPLDEAHISTLGEIVRLLRDRKKYYGSVDSISLSHKDLKVFTVEMQMAVNKKVVFHIQEMETMIARAIKKVEDKQNGIE